MSQTDQVSFPLSIDYAYTFACVYVVICVCLASAFRCVVAVFVFPIYILCSVIIDVTKGLGWVSSPVHFTEATYILLRRFTFY